ncbi:MAG: hypothetical protein HY671_03395 [Chloroflexi bacterium]|nr:hypothetical protein [Chloroflexota bacterium]
MSRRKKAEGIGVLTCPRCGHKQEQEIPVVACIPFYECQGCRELISAEKSCCVFCDYGDRPCPAAAGE